MELCTRLMPTGMRAPGLRALLFCALGLGACAPEPVSTPYTESGRLLALSGGNAGADAACHVCHGLEGEGDGHLTPRLAGLDRGYLAHQMTLFAQGQRYHEQMRWIARHFDPAQRDMVAEYYANMEWSPPQGETGDQCDMAAAQLYHAGDAERGLEACALCHGASGEGVGRGNPEIAGQPAPYIAEQLHQWRTGRRYGDPQGAMGEVARLLADEEIAPLAAYTASLRGYSDDAESPAGCPPAYRPDPRNGASAQQ